MATKQIGKLKYNISKRGIAYKWGDGEIHRFAFQQPREEPEEAYENDQPYDEGYDQPYSDGYDQPYDDAQDGYGEYDEYNNEEYPEEQYPAGFLYENEWVMWAALVVLPPLGIYILWKRQQFDMPVRYGISAASAVWFILLLVLLFSNIFGGNDDVKTNQTDNITITTNAPIPTPKATTAPTPAPTATPAPTHKPSDSTATGDLTVTGTAAPGGTAEDPVVYFTSLGQYYHKQSTCDNMTNGTAGVRSLAMQQGKTACPICFGMGGDTATGGTTSASATDTVYATSNGTYFHKAETCKETGMKNGVAISRADAEARGQYACKECLGVYSTPNGDNYHCIPTCRGMKNAEIVSLDTAKYRGQTACEVCYGAKDDNTVYYHTKGGENFHTDPNCQNMKNAVKTTRAAAVALGQTPCEKCVGTAVSSNYYWNAGGKYYHSDSNCQDVSYKSKGSKSAAEKQGKTACPTCVGVAASSGGNKVYFTKDGQWYHIDDDCQGMKGAVAGTVEQAKKYNKTPCPECIGSSSAKVYGRKDGTYYHVVSDCSGMTDASYISVETAKKAGLTACPECIGGGKTTTNATGTVNKVGYTSSGEKIEVYCTEGGTWYHANATCSNMVGARGTTIAKAIKAGKTACPTCLGSTNSKTVYGTKYGYYYHTNKTCSGMAGANTYTVATAAAAGKVACPVCIGATDTKVFLTKEGSFYHVKSNCSSMTGAQFVTLKDALALGKDMCTKCIGVDSALHKKYGAEIGGPGTVGVTGTPNGTTTGGTTATDKVEDSGFTVYCTENGTYYHTKKYCGTMSGAKATTLTKAALAGKQPCPDCVAATSENAVYCRSDSRYYHTNGHCSGMTAASKVTVSIAKANGKTACPTCAGGEIVGDTTGGTTGGTTSGTTATGDTTKVYCTAGGAYYHKSANACGMTNAQATTIERAKTVHGKEPCPVCYDLQTSGSTSVLTSVFWNPNGVNFHLEDDCRGMKNAVEGTVAQAKAAGKTACPTCFNTENSIRVFTTASDKYYHSKSVCGGEKKTITTTYTKAVQAGKKGCPSCTGKKDNDNTTGSVESTDGKVYATLTSVYYHSNSACDKEDLNGASAISLDKAAAYGKTKCPDCY